MIKTIQQILNRTSKDSSLNCIIAIQQTLKMNNESSIQTHAYFCIHFSFISFVSSFFSHIVDWICFELFVNKPLESSMKP